MDDPGETPLVSAESELNEWLGLFDAPAFARRGQDVESGLKRLDERCKREREAMLDMARMRLRQWSKLADGPEASGAVFAEPIDALWPLCGVEAPAEWSRTPPNPRKLRGLGRDLATAVERFNRRWTAYLQGLGVESLNRSIEQYNRYYVLEKECILGSTRLASRFFQAIEAVTPDSLLAKYPPLPVPTVRR